jgi:hypothetical protein
VHRLELHPLPQDAGLTALHDPHDPGPVSGLELGRDHELGQAAPEGLLGGVAEDVGGARVPGGDPVRAVDGDVGIPGRLQRAAQGLLAVVRAVCSTRRRLSARTATTRPTSSSWPEQHGGDDDPGRQPVAGLHDGRPGTSATTLQPEPLDGDVGGQHRTVTEVVAGGVAAPASAARTGPSGVRVSTLLLVRSPDSTWPRASVTVSSTCFSSPAAR